MSSSWNDRSTWQPGLQTPFEEFGQPLKPLAPRGWNIPRAKLSDCMARCSCTVQVQWERQQGLASRLHLNLCSCYCLVFLNLSYSLRCVCGSRRGEQGEKLSGVEVAGAMTEASGRASSGRALFFPDHGRFSFPPSSGFAHFMYYSFSIRHRISFDYEHPDGHRRNSARFSH